VIHHNELLVNPPGSPPLASSGQIYPGGNRNQNQTIQQQNTPRNDRRPKNKTKVNMAHHWGKMRCPEASVIAEG